MMCLCGNTCSVLYQNIRIEETGSVLCWMLCSMLCQFCDSMLDVIFSKFLQLWNCRIPTHASNLYTAPLH